MKKIFFTILIFSLFLTNSGAKAREALVNLAEQQDSGGELEPLIHFEVKNPVHMVASERFAAVAAWSNEGPQAVIIDIGDPTHSVETATIPFPNIDYILVGATNGVLYVSKGSDGLLIYDLTDLTNPLLVNQFEPIEYMSVAHMVIAGDLAYLSVLYPIGLFVLDISDPLHPALVGTNDDEDISTLAVQGQHLYATSRDSLLIYDVSNPTQPTLVGRYSNPSRPPGIVFTVHGSYAYLPGSIDHFPDPPEYYTDVIDVSNPTAPKWVDDIPQLAVSIQALSVNSGLLYTLRLDGLAIYSIANPLDPQQLGLFPTDSGTGMVPLGDQAFLIDYNTGFLLLDTTDPALPYLKGFLSWPQSAALLVSKGTELYSVETDNPCSNSAEMSIIRVIDVQNPLAAPVSGFFVLQDTPCGKPYIDGSMIYFPGTLGVTILNASDPARMQVASRIGSWSARDVEVLEGVAYAIFDRDGTESSFTITDVSDPSTPQDLSKIVFPEYLNGLSIEAQGANKYAYLTYLGTMVVLDVTDPLNPFEVNRYTGVLGGVVFIDTENRGSQTIAYLGTYAGHMPPKPAGIFAVDVSNPSQPFALGTFPIMSGTQYFDVDHGIVYGAYNSGVMLVDFTDPSHPQQVASAVDPNGSISDAAANEQYLFTATPYQPIAVFALNNDLSGRVTDHNINPISGVSLALSSGASVLTGADGAYSFLDLSLGDYVVTPTLGTYVFSPAWREVNIPSDLSSQDFIILPPPVSTTLVPGITTTLTYTDVQGLPTSFTFPTGLVSTTTTAHITPTLVDTYYGLDFAGHAFDLALQTGETSIYSTTFPAPVNVAIQYSPLDMAVISDTASLALYYLGEGGWLEADDSCDSTGIPPAQEPGIFRSVLCQEGTYALFGATYAIALPQVSYGSDASGFILP
jgi:hypothetical protein